MNLQNWQLDRQLTVLGVSGGIDSMVLLHVFVQNNWPCVVAHVNYNLRGDDSINDMQFVQQECNKLGIECYVKSVNTTQIANELGVSIQMAARDIRYHFFDEVLVKVGAQNIATAHHQDDELENFFIYLMRNQMHSAWLGIPETRGKIIRPLLRISRKKISEFAAENAIQWREDRSNSEVKYLRNKVRHLLIPQLKEAYPDIASDYQNATRLARQIEAEENQLFELRWKSEVKSTAMEWFIPQNFIDNPKNKYGIFKKLIQLNFHESQIIQALSTSQRIGSFWENSQWKMIKLRSGLTIQSFFISQQEPVEFEIKDMGNYVFGIVEFQVNLINVSDVDFAAKNVYYFHPKVLENLKVRARQQGDKMSVFGMKGHKKLSDLMINQKIDTIQKNQLPVLVSHQEIVAVLMLRRSKLYLLEDTETAIAISWNLRN